MSVIERAEAALAEDFAAIARVRLANQRKVLAAFEACGIQPRHFTPTTGYGYSDEGRDLLGELFARAFGAQAGLVRPQFASGTHALHCAARALYRGGVILSASGTPYDTFLHCLQAGFPGALEVLDMGPEGVDEAALAARVARGGVGLVLLQRSRGYADRPALSVEALERAAGVVKITAPDLPVLVDNCYGEFVQEREPVRGVDLCVGSLIKNPGGGLAPTGAYAVGTPTAVEAMADALVAPGLGLEVGSYAGSYLPFFQGLFAAPQVVAGACMGAKLFAKTFQLLGFSARPGAGEAGDLVCAVALGTPDRLRAVCRAVQAASPVDSMAVPEDWDMPGYDERVIMAAGTFVQGSSIELSADGPMRAPYTAYVQGGLCYDHAKIALERVVAVAQGWGE